MYLKTSTFSSCYYILWSTSIESVTFQVFPEKPEHCQRGQTANMLKCNRHDPSLRGTNSTDSVAERMFLLTAPFPRTVTIYPILKGYVQSPCLAHELSTSGHRTVCDYLAHARDASEEIDTASSDQGDTPRKHDPTQGLHQRLPFAGHHDRACASTTHSKSAMR